MKLKSNSNQSILSFSIFRYLNHFIEEFPVDTCNYLLNVFNSNSLEDLKDKSHNMFALIENLFTLNLPPELHNSLIQIVKKCSKSEIYYCKYQADILIKKYGLPNP